MNSEQHNLLGPYLGREDWVHQLVQQTKLFIALMRDHRVHWATKAIPVVTAIYLVSPIDWLQNAVPVLGQIGDVALVALSFRLFLEFSPPEVVHEHLLRLMNAERGRDQWKVVDESLSPPAGASAPEIVDGTDQSNQ